jgi:collagenase-like PrtC family protease
MKFAVGYQLAQEGEESFVETVRECREHVAEVYFAWVGHASGRPPVGLRAGRADPNAQARMLADLACLREMGVGLDLLLNANCYGGRALSRGLEEEIAALLERLADAAGGADVVTTTSPAVAAMVKRHFPRVHTRASVNMRIGTVEGMKL